MSSDHHINLDNIFFYSMLKRTEETLIDAWLVSLFVSIVVSEKLDIQFYIEPLDGDSSQYVSIQHQGHITVNKSQIFLSSLFIK